MSTYERSQRDIKVLDQYFSDFAFFEKLKISEEDYFMKERCYKSMKLKTFDKG